jgi:Ca2+-binding EF-hand superfamily protein
MKKFWRNEVLFIGLSLITTIPVIASTRINIDRVKQYDFDGDHKVSFEDINRYCTVPRVLFDRADKNHDGYLNNFEMRDSREYLLSRCSSIPK